MRLHILSQKSLGGLQTDLPVIRMNGDAVPALYAAGQSPGPAEAACTATKRLKDLLGGCIFSGKLAERAV
ncbi:hypothetical protein [Rhizobium etli]|uniref:hypothetical protein n=1 Tax=Rhizobium etli TaxID=29449 RepID=UPI0026BD5669